MKEKCNKAQQKKGEKTLVFYADNLHVRVCFGPKTRSHFDEEASASNNHIPDSEAAAEGMSNAAQNAAVAQDGDGRPARSFCERAGSCCEDYKKKQQQQNQQPNAIIQM